MSIQPQKVSRRLAIALLLVSSVGAASTTSPSLLLSDNNGDSVSIPPTGLAVCTDSCATTTSSATTPGNTTWTGTLGVFNVSLAGGQTKPALSPPRANHLEPSRQHGSARRGHRPLHAHRAMERRGFRRNRSRKDDRYRLLLRKRDDFVHGLRRREQLLVWPRNNRRNHRCWRHDQRSRTFCRTLFDDRNRHCHHGSKFILFSDQSQSGGRARPAAHHRLPERKRPIEPCLQFLFRPWRRHSAVLLFRQRHPAHRVRP